MDQDSLNLTPAESLFILDLDEASPWLMIETTFADLLMKKAIRISAEEIYGLSSSRKDIYIAKGENHGRLILKPHEKVIANPVYARELWLKDLAQSVYKAIGSLSSYRDYYIREPLCQKDYICWEYEKILYFIPQQRLVLTEKGIDARSRIENIINQARYQPDWLINEPERAEACLSIYDRNTLLDPCYLKIAEQWVNMLLEVEYETARGYNYGW